MLLLSDGTVMAELNNDGGTYGPTWYRLTPDSNGHYINGTWTTLASMINTRLFFASKVLKDGRVFVAGGEYGTGGAAGEVYDPMANAWTATPTPGHTFSDANSEILPDGRVMVALVEGTLRNTLLYNPAANTWATGPTCNGIHNESMWVKLPDDSILMVDRLSVNSERYIPSLNTWITDATVPVSLYDPYGDETGPGFLLPNGKVIFFGATGHTAIYTPSGTTANGSWVAGPDFPNGQGCPDAPGAMLPNGKILVATAPIPISGNVFQSPTSFYEYDYLANAFTQVTAPAGGSTESGSSFQRNFLLLPDGTVLSSRFTSQLYVYTPGGTPLAAGKPAITSITQNGDGSFHLVGTQLNGISEGAAYGDDNQNESNYPLVRMTNSITGTVYYARTYNWSSTSVATGTNLVTAEFTLPTSLPLANYSLVAVANGIASDSVPFSTIPAPLSIQVPASVVKNAGTLTNAGTVLLASALSTNLTVTLISSVPSRLTVAPTATILAGQTSTNFNLAPVDNAVHDGNQTVVVTASAPGFTNYSSSIVVIDDNLPPTITTQPANQTLSVGSTATFSVTATGKSPLNYFWQRNGAFIVGATNSSYTTNNVQLSDSGSQFSCLVTNPFGTQLSSTGLLTVVNLPTDWFTELFSTAAITNFSFSTFTFTPNGSANFYAVCIAAAAAFPTDPTGGTVLAEGDDTSLPITLSGGNTVAIYNTRTNVLFVGSNGYLTMNATDTSYTPTYAAHFTLPRVSPLYRDLNPGAGGTVSWKQLSDHVAISYQGVPVYGSTTQSNTFQVEMFFDGRIRITYLSLNTPTGLVGLSAGSGQPTNFVASDYTTYTSCAPQPPVIVTQPANQAVPVGSNATFTVTATGGIPLSYSWLLNGVPIPGATSFSFTTNNVPLSASGSQFSCLVTNAYGFTNSQAATLTVLVFPPTVTLQPTNQTVPAGGNASFSISATGTPPLNYFWLKNGSPIAGATNTTFTATNVPFTDSGTQFSCLVTNAFGSTNSQAATLTVLALPPTITQQPLNQTVPVGGSATFSVTATGSTPLYYGWLRNGAAILGATNSNYTTNGVQLSDSGTLFSCVVTNAFGSVTSSVAMLTASVAVVVGYYTDQNPGVFGPANPILRVGAVPIQITNITTFDLSTISILFLDEYSNGALSAALQSQLGIIQSWISSGGKLIVHDRSIGTSGSSNPFLLGATNTISVRLTTADVDVVPPTNNLVVAGPYGSIDNTTLDGGNSSAHGYVQTNALPAGTQGILSIGGTSNELVALSYPLGSGFIYYSSIPLDYYLEGTATGTFQVNVTNIYAPNVLAYMRSLGATISLMNVSLGMNGNIQFNVSGQPGDVYRVLASTNLYDWTMISFLTNFTGTASFADPAATNFTQRFYRTVMP